MVLRTSLVHVWKCEDVPGHKVQQELWSSLCSLSCGVYFSTGLGSSFCHLIRNQQELVLYSSFCLNSFLSKKNYMFWAWAADGGVAREVQISILGINTVTARSTLCWCHDLCRKFAKWECYKNLWTLYLGHQQHTWSIYSNTLKRYCLKIFPRDRQPLDTVGIRDGICEGVTYRGFLIKMTHFPRLGYCISLKKIQYHSKIMGYYLALLTDVTAQVIEVGLA